MLADEISDADVPINNAVDSPTEPKMPQTPMDDPEIWQKVRVLEPAKLEQQIQEVKVELIDDTVLERFFINFQLLLDELSRSEYFDHSTI